MKEKNKKPMRTLAERINEVLDISPDILPGGTVIEIRGEYAVSIAGAKKILSYSPEKICLKTKKGAVNIVGERLICTSYHPSKVRIEGHVASVYFEEAEDATV